MSQILNENDVKARAWSYPQNSSFLVLQTLQDLEILMGRGHDPACPETYYYVHGNQNQEYRVKFYPLSTHQGSSNVSNLQTNAAFASAPLAVTSSCRCGSWINCICASPCGF
jgi:hypothetical protein